MEGLSMRSLLAVFLLLIAPVAMSAPKDDRTLTQIVFQYECAHVDAAVTGFKCTLDPKLGVLLTRLHEISKLPKEQGDRERYEFSKFLLRYYDLGFRSVFTVRLDWEPAGKYHYCGLDDTKPDGIGCLDHL
jgi:hypothetical protein